MVSEADKRRHMFTFQREGVTLRAEDGFCPDTGPLPHGEFAVSTLPDRRCGGRDALMGTPTAAFRGEAPQGTVHALPGGTAQEAVETSSSKHVLFPSSLLPERSLPCTLSGERSL